MNRWLLSCQATPGPEVPGLIGPVTEAFRKTWRAGVLAVVSLAALATGFLCPSAYAQENEWTWMGGSSTVSACSYGQPYCGQRGEYGTLKTPASGNMPGSRLGAVTWTDNIGNLWLYGGLGHDAKGNDGPLDDLWNFILSANQWAWMSGSSTVCKYIECAVYGKLGEPAPGNTPGTRFYASSWTDGDGNLWLFGGIGSQLRGQSDYLNDLWKFNPSINEWVWMGGSSTVSLQSGGGYGQPGLYGTRGTPATSNAPGGRQGALNWIDRSGHLWLFGGDGFDANGNLGFLNDLWEFDPSTSQWTWMGGGSTINQRGVYGTMETPASTNIPGGRYFAVNWTDSGGNFWLSSGDGIDSNGFSGFLNDLWKYSPSNNEWTWMNGKSTIPYQGSGANDGMSGWPGVYGTQKIPAAANIPGTRWDAVSWTDSGGNFWLAGGEGYDSASIYGFLNDLWVFNPVDNEWAWMGGSSTLPGEYKGQPGVYGTLGSPATANIPGSRYLAADWTDSSGHLWLFSGNGFDSADANGDLNDLWEYAPSAPVFASSYILSAAPDLVTVVTYVNGRTGTSTIATAVAGGFISAVGLSASGQPAGVTVSFSPNSITGVGTSTMTMAVDSGVAFGTYPITVNGTGGGITQTAAVTLIVTGPPVVAMPTFSPAAGSYSAAQSVTIRDTTPGAAIYYTTDGTWPNTSSSMYSGPITVSSSENIAAIAVASAYTNSPTVMASYTIRPRSALGEWAWMGGSDSVASYGVFSTLGTSAVSNIPGARKGSTRWTDTSGNLWFFGGVGYDANGDENGYHLLNDLWKFDPSTSRWTWVSGSSTTSCTGPHTCGISGAYGTLGVSTPGNVPGARSGAVGWTNSSGHLWLVGGHGYDSAGVYGELNDLWEFDPSTSGWSWMGGSSTAMLLVYSSYGRHGVYDMLGTPAAGNIPGSSHEAATWIDSSGNLWLFGGIGHDAHGDSIEPNGLRKFNPSTNEWTWMDGSN